MRGGSKEPPTLPIFGAQITFRTRLEAGSHQFSPYFIFGATPQVKSALTSVKSRSYSKWRCTNPKNFPGLRRHWGQGMVCLEEGISGTLAVDPPTCPGEEKIPQQGDV